MPSLPSVAAESRNGLASAKARDLSRAIISVGSLAGLREAYALQAALLENLLHEPLAGASLLETWSQDGR